MKRITTIAFLSVGMIAEVYAGGIVTNTNQHAAFDRMMSRDATVGIDGVHWNAAGVAFMKEGHHLAINEQLCFQKRTIVNDYPLFAYNVKNPSLEHKYVGDVFQPIIPSLQYAYNKKNLSLQVDFCFTGGGGQCEFEEGLGSFEQVVAGVGLLGNNLSSLFNINLPVNPDILNPATRQKGGYQYSYDSYMKGRQYIYGLSFGAAYKVLPNLSVFAGVRGLYASYNYNGYLKNISLVGKDNSTMGLGSLIGGDADMVLDRDQSGWGVVPMIGAHFKWKNFDFAAKYEFKARLRLKNSGTLQEIDMEKVQSSMGTIIGSITDPVQKATAGALLQKIGDGVSGALAEYKAESVPADMPALLILGVGYKPIDPLHLNVGFHYFYDRQATVFNNRNRLLDRGTIEWNFGVEYDINKLITVSVGWQNTNYGLPQDERKLAEYMQDKCFVTKSNSVGGGVCLHFSEKFDLNVAYFCSLYEHLKTTKNTGTEDAPMLYKSDFTRTNHVFGVSAGFHF